MKNKKKILQKKKKREYKKKIILIIGIISIIGLSKGVDLSWLDDSPREYTIPEGAISGGEFVGEDGVVYERFQQNNQFYILSKRSGAKIPLNNY